MKKNHVIILLLLCSLTNLYAKNIDHLKSYFKEIEFYKSKIVIKFKDSGARYKVKINGTPSRISRYGEKITIQKNDTLTLISRNSRLSISHCDKLNVSSKMLFKDSEIFFRNAYVINKRVDLRSRGKGFKISKIFIFLTSELTSNEKSSLVKVLKDNPDFLMEEDNDIIIAKYNSKISAQSGINTKI